MSTIMLVLKPYCTEVGCSFQTGTNFLSEINDLLKEHPSTVRESAALIPFIFSPVKLDVFNDQHESRTHTNCVIILKHWNNLQEGAKSRVLFYTYLPPHSTHTDNTHLRMHTAVDSLNFPITQTHTQSFFLSQSRHQRRACAIFPSYTGSGFFPDHHRSQVAMGNMVFPYRFFLCILNSLPFSPLFVCFPLMFSFKASKDAPPPPTIATTPLLPSRHPPTPQAPE